MLKKTAFTTLLVVATCVTSCAQQDESKRAPARRHRPNANFPTEKQSRSITPARA